MATTATSRPEAPDWDALFEAAQAQAGYFTTRQAAAAGYSPQLLTYLGGKKLVRIRRGIYRLAHFPASEQEDLVVLWLWSEQAGVFSHETALALHDLSDALPGKVHLTVPPSWRRRRLRVPQGLVLHFADIPGADRSGESVVPVTAPLRTLRDCIEAGVAPDLVRQAVLQARGRGLVAPREGANLARARRSESAGGHAMTVRQYATPLFWEVPYGVMAANDELAWTTLSELAKAVTTFLDPVLASADRRTW